MVSTRKMNTQNCDDSMTDPEDARDPGQRFGAQAVRLPPGQAERPRPIAFAIALAGKTGQISPPMPDIQPLNAA
jgi:hypothetical protein